MRPTIQLHSGRYFDFLDVKPEDIRVEDIAPALAKLCRYTGHVKEFYSVAQHSVLVSMNVPKGMELMGLFHDAQEAYIGDMSRPLKLLNPAYCELEDRVWSAIAKRFDLPEELPPEVKHADNVLLMTERRDLMPKNLTAQDEWAWANDIPRLKATIYGWAPREAELQFLKRFKQLTGATA